MGKSLSLSSEDQFDSHYNHCTAHLAAVQLFTDPALKNPSYH